MQTHKVTLREMARNERHRAAFWRSVLTGSLYDMARYEGKIRAWMRRCSCDRPLRSTGLCRRCAALSAQPQRRLALMARVRRRLVVALEKVTPNQLAERKAVVQ